MTYNILSTGSKGNAVVVGQRILIDCGVPYKRLAGVIKDISLVLLTHIHSDHFHPRTAASIHSHRPGIRFGCCEWMVQPLLDAGIPARCIDVYSPNHYSMYGGDLSVKPQPLVHNVPNCGYHLLMNGKRIFYATDTGTLEGVVAKNYDLYMVEANHIQADMEERVRQKQAAGAFSYELAAAQNHLSREQAEDWVYQNIGPKGRYVFLHQHIEKEEVPHGMD